MKMRINHNKRKQNRKKYKLKLVLKNKQRNESEILKRKYIKIIRIYMKEFYQSIISKERQSQKNRNPNPS